MSKSDNIQLNDVHNIPSVPSGELRTTFKIYVSKRQLIKQKSLTEADTIYLSHFTNIIKKSKKEKQLAFLKIYPTFKSSINLVDSWIDIYASICNELGKQRKNEHGKINDAQKKLADKRYHINQFLLLGLEHNLLNISRKQSDTIKRYITKKYPEKIEIVKQINGGLENINRDNDRLNADIIKFTENYEGVNEGIITFAEQNTELVANELTRLCLMALKNMSIHEPIYYSLDPTKKDTSKYIHFKYLTDISNKVGYWVGTEILKANDQKTQKQYVDKFIGLIQHFLKLNNYHLAYSVLGGLNNSAITRLKYLKLDSNSNSKLTKIEKLFDTKQKFLNYKTKVESINDDIPIIPCFVILGMDMTFHLEKNVYDENSLNIDKQNIKIIYGICTHVEKCITNGKNIDLYINKNVLEYLTYLNIMDDKDLYPYSIETYPNIEKPENSKRKLSLKKSAPSRKTSSRKLKRNTYDSLTLSNSRSEPIKFIKKNSGSKNRKSLNLSENNFQLPNNQLAEYETWSSSDIGRWLNTIGLSAYKRTFKKNEITGTHIDFITNEHMEKDLGIYKLGPRLTLREEIEKLKNMKQFL